MKIAYIDETAFTRRHGGAANWTLQILNFAKREGMDVEIFSFAKHMQSSIPDKIKLFPYFRELFLIPFFGIAIIKQLEQEYDIIHFSSSTTSAYYKASIPTVVSTNCLFSRQMNDFLKYLPAHYKFFFNRMSFSILKRLEGKSYDHADYILATRSDIKKFVVETLNQPEKKVMLCPHGVDLNRFVFSSKRHSENNVIFVGRATFGKGFDTLLEASDRIEGKVICVVSRIAKKYHPLLDRRRNVEIKANISPEAINRLYQKARIFVMPSLSETGPLVTLEAMANGLPVVGTAQGCGDYVKDGENGFIVPAADPVALASAVNYLLKNKELANQMGLANRLRVEKEFSLEKIGKRIIQLYHSMGEAL